MEYKRLGNYSRGDRYLSHSSRHTQVPVPLTNVPLTNVFRECISVSRCHTESRMAGKERALLQLVQTSD